MISTANRWTSNFDVSKYFSCAMSRKTALFFFAGNRQNLDSLLLCAASILSTGTPRQHRRKAELELMVWVSLAKGNSPATNTPILTIPTYVQALDKYFMQYEKKRQRNILKEKKTKLYNFYISRSLCCACASCLVKICIFFMRKRWSYELMFIHRIS